MLLLKISHDPGLNIRIRGKETGTPPNRVRSSRPRSLDVNEVRQECCRTVNQMNNLCLMNSHAVVMSLLDTCRLDLRVRRFDTSPRARWVRLLPARCSPWTART